MENIIFFRYILDSNSSARIPNDNFQLIERNFSGFATKELALEYEAENEIILRQNVGDQRFLEKLFGKRNAFGQSEFTSNLYEDIPSFLNYHFQAYQEFW